MHTLEPRQRSQYHDQNRKMWKCVGGEGWKSLKAAAYHVAQEYAVYWAMLTDTQRVILSSLCLLGSHTRWLLPSVPSTSGRAEDHVLAYKVRYSFLSKKKKRQLIKETISHINEEQYEKCHTSTQICISRYASTQDCICEKQTSEALPGFLAHGRKSHLCSKARASAANHTG